MSASVAGTFNHTLLEGLESDVAATLLEWPVERMVDVAQQQAHAYLLADTAARGAMLDALRAVAPGARDFQIQRDAGIQLARVESSETADRAMRFAQAVQDVAQFRGHRDLREIAAEARRSCRAARDEALSEAARRAAWCFLQEGKVDARLRELTLALDLVTQQAEGQPGVWR